MILILVMISRNQTFWIPVYTMNDVTFQSGFYLTLTSLSFIFTALVIIRTVKVFSKVKLFHENMNRMMKHFLYQWVEAIIGKIILLPYQIGYIKLNNSTKSYVSWWSEDQDEMIGVDGQTMHGWVVLFASFLIWHYAYSMIFGIINLGVERVFATVMLRDYEAEHRSYIPIILLILTHLITTPFSLFVLTNSVGFYIGISPCFINSAITFLIFTLVWKVNQHRRSLIERPGASTDYSVSQHYQVKENYRALKLAKNLMIVVLCAMSIPCALLIMLVMGWLTSWRTLFIHVMENAIFLNPILVCTVLMSSDRAWRAEYFCLLPMLKKMKTSQVSVVPKPIEMQPRESVAPDEGQVYFEDLRRAWS